MRLGFSILPTLLNSLADSLGVLLPVILIEIRCLDVGWRTGVRIVKQTALEKETRVSLAGDKGMEKASLGSPLDTCQDGGDIISWAPSVLEDVQTQLSGGVDIGMKHLTDEFDGRWLIRILFLKMHHKTECSILEGSVGRTNNDCVPAAREASRQLGGFVAEGKSRKRGEGEERAERSSAGLFFLSGFPLTMS